MSKLAGIAPYREVGNSNMEVERVTGRFTTTTSGAILAGTVIGKGFTVSKVSGETGRYLVTCGKGYKTLLHVTTSLMVGTSDAHSVRALVTGADPGDVRTGASFLLETHTTDGTEANISGFVVSFEAVFSNVG
jgi:hypothetical protein